MASPLTGLWARCQKVSLKLFLLRKTLAAILAQVILTSFARQAKPRLRRSFGKATEFFSAALDLEADNPDALVGLAQTYLAIDAGDAAREILASIPPAQTNNPDVLALKAQLGWLKKPKKQAILRICSPLLPRMKTTIRRGLI